MRAFFKQTLKTLQAKTGIRQLENLMQKENWREEANLLIDLMIEECNRPPFDMVKQEVKERVISDAIINDQEFIGLNAKFIRKALNAWWGIYGGKILEARDAKAEDVYKKPELTKEQNEFVDTMVNSYVKRLMSGDDGFKAPPKMSRKEIEQQGQTDPPKPVYIPDPVLILEHQKKLHEARFKTIKERHPDLSDEEIEERILKMPTL